MVVTDRELHGTEARKGTAEKGREPHHGLAAVIGLSVGRSHIIQEGHWAGIRGAKEGQRGDCTALK